MKNLQLVSDVRNTIRKYSMLQNGDRVLLCVSGGPDSMFMLYAMEYLADEFGIKLFVAHLDHGLRGRESDMDAAFVKKCARNLKLKCFSKKVHLKKSKLSLEEVAREARYSFFLSMAKKHRFNKIATAHNIGDQAETVLMGVIRGASIKGLSGIPPVREQGDKIFIRPVIEISKDDIRTFLDRHGIRYRIDRTNKENKHFRNIVRNRVIPYLEKLNPGLTRSLSSLSASLREDRAFIESCVSGAEGMAVKTKTGFSVPLSKLSAVPEAVQKELVRGIMMRMGGNVKKLTYGHWESVRGIIRSGGNGKQVDIPGGLTITRTKTALEFRRK